MLKTFVVTTATTALMAFSALSAEISKKEVYEAQDEWRQGIIDIGRVYQNDGDYRARAKMLIDELYAYGITEEVLFKPTLASYDQFRETPEQALSYFVGGIIEEDKGFAIKPWSKVRFGKQKIITDQDSALAMGNYYFTPVGSNKETKVEYTFGYVKDEEGNLRIKVHHSSLPHQN